MPILVKAILYRIPVNSAEGYVKAMKGQYGLDLKIKRLSSTLVKLKEVL
jgi:hypothetical protein